MTYKPFKRTLDRSVLDSFINGNINQIPEDEKLLCMSYLNELQIDINEDLCSECGESKGDCTCKEDEEQCLGCGYELSECECE